MKQLIYILIAALMCVNTAYAQSLADDSETKYPHLNGHMFPSFSHFKSSFITTSLQANLGFGTTAPLKINGLKFGDYEIFEFEGKILFLTMGVEYQQRFNKWMAMFFSFTMAGRSGTDMNMIMADGINTISGGNIGWLIRIKQSRKFNLSATLKVSNLTGNFINVSQYFSDLINNVPYPSVIKKIPAMNAGLGLIGAWAISPMFGLQFHTDGALGESFQREGTNIYYSAGVLGDIDFMPKQKVPIGLALGYTISSAPDILSGDNEAIHLIIGKIGYTASGDFDLGLQYSYYKMKMISVNRRTDVSSFSLVLKLYF